MRAPTEVQEHGRRERLQTPDVRRTSCRLMAPTGAPYHEKVMEKMLMDWQDIFGLTGTTGTYR